MFCDRVSGMFADLLLPMFDDEYYPDVLVAEVKLLVVQFAKKIAKADLSSTDIYHFANETVAQLNKMKPQFEDLDSSLDDTAARLYCRSHDDGVAR